MSRYIRYFFFLILTVFIFSCKKKTPEDIGLPILPGEDLLNAAFTDTATIIAHTVRDDSLRTNFISPMFLGNANDPLFGVSKASLFSQLALSETNPTFGTKPKLDSAVLSLVYSDGKYYGTLYPQKFKVYEISESFSIDSTYYSNRMLQYSRELGSAYLVPRVKDSIKVDTLKYPPHLRIKLDKNFFQGFLDDTTFYSASTDFQKFFKGIYVTSSSGSPVGQGAILSMNLVHTYSRLTLFYHNSKDTTSYHFGISNSGCARFTHFQHDYSYSAEITSQLNTASSIPKEKVFVQPMAGLRAKIKMPYLKDLFNNGKIVINKAELILPVDPLSFSGADSIFSPCPQLALTIADSAKGPVFMPDYYEGPKYFGGEYISSAKEYRFNIARYVQQILNGSRINEGLYLLSFQRPTNANRVQLMGGIKTLPSRMKLKVTYTPVK